MHLGLSMADMGGCNQPKPILLDGIAMLFVRVSQS